LLPVSTTPAVPVVKFAAGTRGKFATYVVDSKFATCVVDTGCKFAICVIDTVVHLDL
jgi:hypothetical protein